MALDKFLLFWVAASQHSSPFWDDTSLVQSKVAPHSRRIVPDYWTGKNGDLLRSGASFAVAPIPDPGMKPSWSWFEKVGKRSHELGALAPNNKTSLVRATPLIDAQKNIYLTTLSGGLYKMNEDGKLIWRVKTGSSIPDVPAMSIGKIFATTSKGWVFAVDKETGEEAWRQRIGDKVGTDAWSMTAGDGVVISATSSALDAAMGNDEIVALNDEDGKRMWSYRFDGKVYNFIAAIKNGSVVFSDGRGRAFKLNLLTGEEEWSSAGTKNAGLSTGGAVLGPNDLVYVTSNVLHNQNNDQQAKKLGMLITMGDEQRGMLTAFHFQNGTLAWRRMLPYQANSLAAVGELGPKGKVGLAVVVGAGRNPNPRGTKANTLGVTAEKPGSVLAYDAKTGDSIWEFQTQWTGVAAGDQKTSNMCMPDAFSSPAIGGDGTVYIGFENGYMYALKDKNGDGHVLGKEASFYDALHAFQGSPGLAPGMLVTTPCDGIHVFKMDVANTTNNTITNTQEKLDTRTSVDYRPPDVLFPDGEHVNVENGSDKLDTRTSVEYRPPDVLFPDGEHVNVENGSQNVLASDSHLVNDNTPTAEEVSNSSNENVQIAPEQRPDVETLNAKNHSQIILTSKNRTIDDNTHSASNLSSNTTAHTHHATESKSGLVENCECNWALTDGVCEGSDGTHCFEVCCEAVQNGQVSAIRAVSSARTTSEDKDALQVTHRHHKSKDHAHQNRPKVYKALKSHIDRSSP